MRMTNSDTEPIKVAADENEEEVIQSAPCEMGWRNLVAFWILGLCNNYGYVVMLSAAHDILAHEFHVDPSSVPTPPPDPNRRECNTLSTGAILLADVIPSLFVKITAPFFPLWIHARMVAVISLSIAGYILVGASSSEWVAILGVICTAFSSGLGEATLLSYMAFFRNKNVISTWSSGTGGAGFFGSLSYAFLTSIGLSPSMTLYVLLVIPVTMALVFWLLLKHPVLKMEQDNGRGEPNVESQISSTTINTTVADDVPLTTTSDTFTMKLKAIPPLFSYMIPVGLVYLFEYFINQGLFELIYFDHIWLKHAEQYRWYQVLYQIGVFISRSSINIIQINAIWVLSILQGINVILFTVESLYSLSPNIYIVFVAVLWEGLLGGAAYVNTFHKIAVKVAPEKREFSMAITSLADALGITLAGFLAMPVHNYICTLPRNLHF